LSLTEINPLDSSATAPSRGTLVIILTNTSNMKVIYLIILLITFDSFSQVKDNKRKSPSLITTDLKNLNQKQKTDPMPWIVSLIIAGATVGINVYIAKLGQKTSIKNIRTQIEASTQNSEKQLEVNRDIVIKQIENSQSLALSQYKSTLNTKNRQDWINTLQHCVSDFLSQCIMLQMINKTHVNRDDFFEKFFPFLEKMTYNRAKVAMLVNFEKQDHKDLILSFDEILSLWSSESDDENHRKFQDAQGKIMLAANKITRDNWQKIKDISK